MLCCKIQFRTFLAGINGKSQRVGVIFENLSAMERLFSQTL